jgi:hypothetical protein
LEADYQEIRGFLNLAQDIAYRICNEGPYTADELTALGLAKLTADAEKLAERGLQALQAPLLEVASVARRLSQTAVPDVAPDTGQVVRTVLRHAVAQDRAARELAEAVHQARLDLRDEWGS